MSPRQKTETPKETLKVLESINIRSSVAVYVQIENCIRFAIAKGILKAGDQLPSVRELSERLEVNPNTVAKSYRDLEVMGLLYTRRGMGVFINKGIEAKCKSEVSSELVSRIHEVVAEAKAAGWNQQDVLSVVRKCFESDAPPYALTPPHIAALARNIK